MRTEWTPEQVSAVDAARFRLASGCAVPACTRAAARGDALCERHRKSVPAALVIDVLGTDERFDAALGEERR